MSDPEVVEKKTTVTQQPQGGQTGQTTNINVRPDGGADVQVNEGTAIRPAVVEETTTTRKTI